MIEVFYKDITSLFKWKQDHLSKEIEDFSDSKIIGADFTEWQEYFLSKYRVEPITLHQDYIATEFEKAKIKIPNRFRQHRLGEPEYYIVDGIKVNYDIPFSGDESLFDYKPTRFFMSTFEINQLIPPSEDDSGHIIFSLEFSDQELAEKSKVELNSFVTDRFVSEFKYYNESFTNLNDDISRYNQSLNSMIATVLNTRKNKASAFAEFVAKLDIPLKTDPNIPQPKPIPITKKSRPIQKPSHKAPCEQEYGISDSDYKHIKSIISMAGRSFEKTAMTYNQFGEEDLRNAILSNLNTHYQEQATGETFNKVGKTDIHIQFDHKSAYIAECKLWHGEKALSDALSQLFSYTTWRETKTSIIIFNKNNKDFNKVIETIDSFLQNNGLCQTAPKDDKNEWNCVFFISLDSTEKISVHIIVFNLFI